MKTSPSAMITICLSSVAKTEAQGQREDARDHSYSIGNINLVLGVFVAYHRDCSRRRARGEGEHSSWPVWCSRKTTGSNMFFFCLPVFIVDSNGLESRAFFSLLSCCEGIGPRESQRKQQEYPERFHCDRRETSFFSDASRY